MSTRLAVGVFLALLIQASLSPSHSFAQGTPEYEVYAIEYATLPDMSLAELLPGADSTLIVDLSAMIWLIRGPGGTNILVDAGYRPDLSHSTKERMTGYERPDLALARLGVEAKEISDIILTHIHWDHADGLPLFPNAQVWIQEAELEYYADQARERSGDSIPLEPRFVDDLVRRHREGRVNLVQGDDQEIFDGIRVYTGPRHTFASQYVGVNTAGGTVIIASDCAWFYANLEQGLANSLTFDPEADLAAFERMKSLAGHPDWIIPGHDKKVFEKFQGPVEGVARIR
jgi:glyoxylase-like metal-dependent hydrolase (beta-lactamase superfamily II)